MTKTIKNKQETPALSPAQQVLESSLTIPDDTSSLATIRDILFGEQVREVEQKRQHLQHELRDSIDSLRHSSTQQFEKLYDELHKLRELLSDEVEQRKADIGTGTRQLSALNDTVSKIDQKHTESEQAIREQLLQETDKLDQQARSWYQEVSEKLERASRELKSDKTDRGDLAKMLRGVAEQLLDEPKG